MRAAPRLIGYRLGEPMSAVYPPEHQQSPPQPPPEVPYWRRPWPKRAGIAGLAVAFLLVGAGIGGTPSTGGNPINDAMARP